MEQVMNKIKFKALFLSFISALIAMLILGVLSPTAFASYKQWPLKHKGEVRYLRMIKVYDIGLYSPTVLTSKNVLNSNVSKCLKLDYAVTLSVDKFRLATSKVLQRQHTPEYLKIIQAPLEKLQKAYQPVKKGDFYTLCYNSKNKVMSLGLNDKNLVNIQSVELAKAYLGIWLSDNNPISSPLYSSFFKNS